ncbi:DNA mismatch repair endonuclease MutL [Psychrosphaera ytuae]|uniref:DNA mismatch repair protein MutL n=1 Tax=Psychrosphaera ytuae TaxID=2820710 RepID=A0A975D9U5_9GAMM|nr:DNA mismatch repair endonuclease MutL [Psychrosphaera ytuae]QTH63197.1 DNA mismatch repair endonuclease MutL [Psychrosphaera ytuae]
MTIQILPPQLANQIAAGEVVERPSSVVKELVENALDAGATKIEIDIERGGHKKILIKDDGKGIPKDQLALALSRHATSKIANIEDLEAIVSLGFRGEALASISSVSRLTITSKPKTQNEAWSAIAEGLDMAVDVKPAAHPNGTSVEVIDLFFNTPARRKFLRAEKTEFSHIETLIRRIAMSRPEITFVLKHNGKTVKRYRSQCHLDDAISVQSGRISEVISSGFLEMTSVRSVQYDQINISVWACRPDMCKSVNPAQYAFVNGRMMRDKLIQHAIRQAYANSLHAEQQPEYVLFIELPADEVDVNVHPAKHEVRFHHARLLHDLIVTAFQDCIQDFSRASMLEEPVPIDSDKDFQAVSDQSTQPEVQRSSEYVGQVQTESQKQVKPDWLVTPQNYQTAVNETQIERSALVAKERSTPSPMSSTTSFPGLKPKSTGTEYQNRSSLTQLQLDECTIGTEIQSNDKNLSKLGSVGHLERTPQSVSSIQSDISKDTLQVLSVEGDAVLFWFEQQVWASRVSRLLSWSNDTKDDVGQQPLSSLSVEQKEPAPLLVPIRIRLEPEELSNLKQIDSLLEGIGFGFKQHNNFLIIKQVPSFIRSKNNNHALPEFFAELLRLMVKKHPSELISEQQIVELLVKPATGVNDLEKIIQELRILTSTDSHRSRLKQLAKPLEGRQLLQWLAL